MDNIQKQKNEFDALYALIKALSCMPSVVDDDYEEMRHHYESALRTFLEACRVNGRIQNTFSIRNRIRCEAVSGFNHPLSSWSLSDWMTATFGELGEAANVVKKLNRSRDGVRGNNLDDETLRNNLRKELGDVFVYLDLMAQAAGFNILDAANEVFESKSKQIGYSERGFAG